MRAANRPQHDEACRGEIPRIYPERRAMTCPAETLACRAAQILRAMKALGHPDLRDAKTSEWDQSEFPLVKTIADNPNAPTVGWAERALFRELIEISHAAALVRAESVKGALFQAYLGAEAASGVTGHISTAAVSADELYEMQQDEDRAARLLRSAVRALEALHGMDGDLEILRQWFLNPRADTAELLASIIHQAA